MDKVQNKEASQQIATGSFYKALLSGAVLHPEKPLVIEAETGQTISYAQALTAVNRTLYFLGTSPHTIVMALHGGIISAVVWLCALSGGHRLVPVSPAATEQEKARIASKYRPDIAFVEQKDAAEVFGCSTVMTPEACEALFQQTHTHEYVAANLCEGQVYLQTSGTTGEPKGVALTERQITWTAKHVCISHQLTSLDRGLTVLPFFHVNAPVVSLCSSLLAGATVVIARRFSRRNFWSWIERYQVTWASVVPTIIAMLLQTEKPAFLPGSLRFIRTGSSALPAADLQAFEARFAIPLIETYGLSEAASQVVANPLPPATRKPGSAGRPVGVELRICYPRSQDNEEQLRDVPPGEVGEICVMGPAVIHAYQDGADQQSFQDGWFRTGDLGRLDEDGYLFITGRKREVINRGGENIAPREVEEVLMEHPNVREVAVVGRPDPIYGEQVVAYVSIHGTWDAALSQSLHEYARQHLSTPKVPIDFIVLDALPRNATGKLSRHLLKTREYARFGMPHNK